MRRIAIVLIIAAAASRVVGLYVPGLANFSPLMALAFCSGVYFRSGWLWLVPFAALMISDLYIDAYYAAEFHYSWGLSGAVVRMLCFAAGLAIGALVARRRNGVNLLSGALGVSLLFYLATNSMSWLGDAGYARSLAGWWQAMTVGHPQYPPTLYFFRNTLVSDLLFTGIFVCVMEYAAWRRGEPSLLGAERMQTSEV